MARDDESLLAIDKDRLDEEWVGQPARFLKYAKRLADARASLETSEARLDVVKADLDRRVRTEPELFGISKISEDRIKATIILQDAYQKAVKETIELKHRVDVYKAVVDGLSHRKTALENLVVLYCQEYWAEPRAPKGEAREVMEKAGKRSIRRKGMKRDE